MAESSSDSWNRKFYTDLNDMRIEFGLPPKKYHLDLLEDEVFTRTIFIKIHDGIYAISDKELNQVFSTFGTLDTVEVFRHGHGFHSKVCFISKESTIRAFDSLNGRNIYDNCCRLELFLVQESDKNVDRGTIDKWNHQVELESPGCQMETERQFYEVDKGRNVLQVQYAVAKDDSMNRKIDDTTESSVPTSFGTPSDVPNHDFLVQVWEDEPPFRFELPEVRSFQGEEDANLFDPCKTSGEAANSMGLEVGGEASAAQSELFHSETPILQSTVFNGDAMGLNRPSFLEGFKSENPNNPRLNPTPSNLGVCLNRVELGKEDRRVNGSRVLHTEINNTIEDSTQQVVPSKVVQVTKEPFVDAYHMFDEMLKENFEIFQHSKVTFVPSADSKMVYDDMGDMCDHSIDWTGSRVYVGVTKSIECLGNHLAHKVFEGIPNREIPMEFNEFLVFDPGGVVALLVNGSILRSSVIEATIDAESGFSIQVVSLLMFLTVCVMLDLGKRRWVFDPGIAAWSLGWFLLYVIQVLLKYASAFAEFSYCFAAFVS